MAIDWLTVLYIIEAASTSLGIIALAVTAVAMWDAAINKKYHELKKRDTVILMLANAEFRRELTRTMSQSLLLSISTFNILVEPPPEYVFIFAVNVIGRTTVQFIIFYASLRERFDRDRIAEELETKNGPTNTNKISST